MFLSLAAAPAGIKLCPLLSPLSLVRPPLKVNPMGNDYASFDLFAAETLFAWLGKTSVSSFG